MAKRIIILISIAITFNNYAQTNVDNVVEELNLLCNAVLDNWKYSTNFSAKADEISRIDFDDSQWQNLHLNESIYPDSCWLRKVIELPKFIAGEPVSGRIKFIVSVDDYGYFYINGESKGYFPWDGEFTLTESAETGAKYVLLIKAVNTGGPLRIINAKLNFDKELPLQKMVNNFTLSLRVGQKLLSFDTYQTNSRVKVDPKIDKSTVDKERKIQLNELLQTLATQLDIEALRKGDTEKFLSSLENVKSQLKPVSDFAKEFKLHFTANAHIDAAWLWRKKETVDVCYKTFSSVIKMFEARPDFTYSQSQAVFYEWMEKQYPELFEKIKQYQIDGRWEIVGGMWIEPDCNLPDGISWARQMLYAQYYFIEKFGLEAVLGWDPDSFGYNWNLPQFLLQAGIKAFITQKIGWNDTSVFPYRLFWWQSPDSSKILTYFPFDYVNTIEDPFKLVDWMRQFEANTGFKNQMILFGIGDHGGGPSLEMMARIDELKTLDIYPTVEFGDACCYIEWLVNQDIEDLPVWNDELYLEYHRGTFTTQSNTKKWNRHSEVLLSNTEKYSTFSNLFGNEYNYQLIDKAWKTVLFNQFHDILPGSSINEVYYDADKDYSEATKLANFVLDKSFKAIADNINTSDCEETPVVVFNPLSWERTDIVKITLPDGDFSQYEIYDSEGNKIVNQMLKKNELQNEIIFIAESIPSLGYKVYEMRKSNSEKLYTNYDNIPNIENEFFKVTIDTDSGWVSSIIDKRNNFEILSDYGNRLQILEDKPRAWDAWNIGLTGVEFPSNFRKYEIIENGPIKKVIRLYRDYLKPGVVKEYPTEYFPSSFAYQDIILYNGIDRIDFETCVDWWEEKTMLKTAFPLTISDTIATYEIPNGAIKRSTKLEKEFDKGKWEVPALRWADLSDEDYGVSLLNKAKYGYDIKGNVVRLSLLRSPKWPDKTADMGEHLIEYSLYPHKGNYKDAHTIQEGYEYNYPLLVFITEKHDGELPILNSFISVNKQNVVITSIKKSYDKLNAWVIQFYETEGIDTEVEITLNAEPISAYLSNFMEEEWEKIELDGKIVKLKIKANSTNTIRVNFE